MNKNAPRAGTERVDRRACVILAKSSPQYAALHFERELDVYSPPSMVISERLTDTQTKGARTILYNTCPFGNKYADIHNPLKCCACFEVPVASPIQFRLLT